MTGFKLWLQTNKSTQILGWATLVVSIVILIIVFKVPSIDKDTAASRNSDEIGVCRDEAHNPIDKVEKRWRDAMGLAVATAIRQDTQALIAIADDLDEISDDMETTQAKYEADLVLAREDPEEFLANCRDK